MSRRSPDITTYDLTATLSANLTHRAEAARVWDQLHAVATLQGIVNRNAPRLYLRYVTHGPRNIDDYWLDHLTKKGTWLEGATIRPAESLEELFDLFRHDIGGAVVYDADLPALSNVASALAGAEDLVAIRLDKTPDSLYDRLVVNGPRLELRRLLTREAVSDLGSGSAKCDAYLWAIRELIETGRCDPRWLGYYIDAYWIDHAEQSVPNHHTLTNHDFFVAQRAFFCDLDCWEDEQPVDDPHQPMGADLRTFRRILHELQERRRPNELLHVGGFTPWAFKYTDHGQAGGRHFGVDSEWELVRLVSEAGGFLDADAIGHGAMANASFFMHFPLEQRYHQRHAARTTDPSEGAGDVDWIMFYVGDFDSAAWLYQRAPDIWSDIARGRVPLNWAVSPVLCRRVPMILDWLWRTRTVNDHFIAADNGAGYANPSAMIDPSDESAIPRRLAAWKEHNAAFYDRWDIRVTGFIIDGLAPPSDDRVLRAYAEFSPDGIVCQRLAEPARLIGDTPVLRAGPDLIDDCPAEAAERVLQDVSIRREHGLRHHWYRSILRTPTWHLELVSELRRKDARIAIVSASQFFGRLKGDLARERRR